MIFFDCPSSAHRFDTSMLELLVPQKEDVFGGDGHIQPGGASDRGLLEPPLSSSPITGLFSCEEVERQDRYEPFIQSGQHGAFAYP